MGADLAATLERHAETVRGLPAVRMNGRITRVVGLVMEGVGTGSSVGELCLVYPRGARGARGAIRCEVVGFSEDRVILMPLGDVRGVGPGSRIVAGRSGASVSVGPGLLGRTIDGLGEPIDGLGPVAAECEYPLYNAPPNPLMRRRISSPLGVGVKAINGLLTVGKGQRVGIFAGSGVGKSVLMGMMARSAESDVNVIALVGERGREVKEFIEKDLGPEGLARSVLVVATSDQPPLVRMRAALMATAIAEYFRDQGRDVLLLMDSITRFAMAQREVALAAGEPPATRGYPPSVFALLPKLLERAGTGAGEGSITGFYTILAEGDDAFDPVADASRAILDGQVALSRRLAVQGHYPAIDVLESISRVMTDIVTPEHREVALKVRSLLAAHARAADLISIGAYKEGSDPKVDHAISAMERVRAFLTQDMDENVGYDDSLQRLFALPI